jgi:hypothetical protein
MKNNFIKITALLLLPCLFLLSCEKNETKFYSDDDNNGLSVFSNTGDNIFTCYVNGVPWRTLNRTCCGFLSGRVSELFIRQQADSLHNMLVIDWMGNLQGNNSGFDDIYLYLYIPANFTYQDFDKLQGTRIAVDSTTGYFSTSIQGISGERGTGFIYFNQASFDSSATSGYGGSFSGLLEANFPGSTISKGRFDHQLTLYQIYF